MTAAESIALFIGMAAALALTLSYVRGESVVEVRDAVIAVLVSGVVIAATIGVGL